MGVKPTKVPAGRRYLVKTVVSDSSIICRSEALILEIRSPRAAHSAS